MTIQPVAVAAHHAAKGGPRTLVICPASLVINWRNEMTEQSRVRSRLLHGPDRDRQGTSGA